MNLLRELEIVHWINSFGASRIGTKNFCVFLKVDNISSQKMLDGKYLYLSVKNNA